MELQYLKEFVVLAEQLNFRKASEELYISQPVLSKHIANLEKELEMPLFRRNSRNVSLTEQGNKYLPYAKAIVKEYDKSEEFRNGLIKDNANTLMLGLVPQPQIFGLDKNLIEFHNKYPQFKIHTIEDTDKNLLKMLEQGTINLITTGGAPGDFSDDEFIPAFRGTFDVCISSGNQLADSEHLTLEDICGIPIYIPQKDNAFSLMLEKIFEEKGISQQYLNYANYDAEMRYAAADLGVAIMPSHIINNYDTSMVKQIPLKPAIPYITGLKYIKGRPLSGPEKAFIRYSRAFAATLK